MRQVIKHRDIRLLNMIRRTDPVIPENRPRDSKLGGKVKSQARNVSFSLKNGGLSGKNVTFAAEKLRVREAEQAHLFCRA